MRNSAAMAAALAAAGASEIVYGAEDLAVAVDRLLAEPALRQSRAAAAARVAAAGRGVLDAVMERIAPWLDPLAPVAAPVLSGHLRAVAGANARA